MLANFHLAAICQADEETVLLQIPLHQRLQDRLSVDWEEQRDLFLKDIEEIQFDAGYQPEMQERFCLTDYELPPWLEDQNSYSIHRLHSIGDREEGLDEIKGLAAFAYDEDENEIILFQNFTRGRIIQPGRFLFLMDGTFRTPEATSLSLDRRLSAVYLADREALLFSNFRTVNTFLPLEEYFAEAAEHEMLEVLGHDRLSADNPEHVIAFADQWFRKRFAMLRQSNVLDTYSAMEIKEHSNRYEIEIELQDDTIVFPSEKREAKRLLQFLNEELFRGAITDTLYETNSKRRAV